MHLLIILTLFIPLHFNIGHWERLDWAWAGEGDEAHFARLREEMVREQIATPPDYREPVRDARVLEAMRTVPRHLFVKPKDISRAYGDFPLPIGYGQTISQPYIVAFMTELLDLRPEHRVLEVGTGSGYQAAILSVLVKEVFTVEIIEALAEQAKARLRRLGYLNVHVKNADGYFGWEEDAPFDRIIVTAAATLVPPPLIRQLRPGGRMVIPVGGQYTVQYLTVVEKDLRSDIRMRKLLPGVRFVPLTRALR
ncbi:MAG: protein-L-isoaspartate(D-aspartate) O-methyltransferase [Deltaproteobacteria bacterium]|nr:protein-L-isoaspartate(D-aspartate) O-methyltransferase [Deltaproteobacteria bacterium]